MQIAPYMREKTVGRRRRRKKVKATEFELLFFYFSFDCFANRMLQVPGASKERRALFFFYSLSLSAFSCLGHKSASAIPQIHLKKKKSIHTLSVDGGRVCIGAKLTKRGGSGYRFSEGVEVQQVSLLCSVITTRHYCKWRSVSLLHSEK